jgi:RNA polymerase sigma factor (sigma-70 family)
MAAMVGRIRRDRGASSAAPSALPSTTQPEQFEHFYLREVSRVVALAYALSGDRATAQDIAQDAFLVAHQQWHRIGNYEDPGAWVRRVAANLAVSVVRRRLAEARALVRMAGRREPAYAELSSQDADFWRAVRGLPRRQAQVVALVALGDLSTAEVARTLGCSQRMVQVHLQKARAALTRRLDLIPGDD